MELYDILTLDDDKDYALLKMEKIKEETYCLLVEVDKDENPLENSLILRRIALPDDTYEFEELNEEEYSMVSEIFQEQLMNEIEEEEAA